MHKEDPWEMFLLSKNITEKLVFSVHAIPLNSNPLEKKETA